ncbi:hypothetical protein [Robertkochia aurantiaca]|uniref:hypothetical protein n=1 Tax=Robertkochia aurantiaca TaxID=2873700 RepID=UPI001CCBFBDA|nr:hypothetical protein [Robertkochia sp. 3YJGBD-33]
MRDLQVLPESYLSSCRLPDLLSSPEGSSGENEYLKEFLPLIEQNIQRFIHKTSDYIYRNDFQGIGSSARSLLEDICFFRLDGINELMSEMVFLSRTRSNMGQIIRLFNIFIDQYPFLLRNLRASFQ